jgi:hypothetical protein
METAKDKNENSKQVPTVEWQNEGQKSEVWSLKSEVWSLKSEVWAANTNFIVFDFMYSTRARTHELPHSSRAG